MSRDLTRRAFREASRDVPTRRSRVRSVVSITLIGLLSVFAFLTIVVPHLLGAQTYTVLTGSMSPGMPPGTMIAVRPAPIDAVHVGDVVTYQIRSGAPAVVTHRVVGTTLSTGGHRLLLTRGDANDVDDPPVQSAQLRGIVVMAVPYLGYPGVLLDGRERGALVSVVGGIVVGYGVISLLVDLVRSRRHGAPTALGAVLVASALAAPLVPAPARADETVRAASAPSDAYLQVGSDGVRFVTDGSIDLAEELSRLTPGSTVATTLWIRNAGADPARASLGIDVDPADDSGHDRALAAAIEVVVDGRVIADGDEWRSAVIAAGETVRVALGLRMNAEAANGTRRAAVVATPVVRLEQHVNESVPTPSSGGALALSGVDAAALAGPAALSAAAVAAGVLTMARRHSRR